MTPQSKSPKCQSDTSYCQFGAETLLDLLGGFGKNIDGVIENKDIECVHKTRVTSRKIRAALPLFQPCFPPKAYKKWTKEIKKVTRLLGSARDLDVQIEFIEDYMKKLEPSDKKSLNILLANHKSCRKNVQAPVVDGLEELKESRVLRGISDFCEEAITEQSAMTFNPGKVREKAHWEICFKLDDFLSLEKYVHQEKENLKHHEMRIKAKKLRYTMEFFEPLYEKGLQKQIEVVKNYQDILGEKHDFEVWMDFLPEFIKKIKSQPKKVSKINVVKLEQALLKFLEYIKEKRKEKYIEFVHLWDENKKNGFFDELMKITETELDMSEDKGEHLFSNPDVKIAVISDVHANLQALQAVIKDAEERGADVFFNAGDSIGFGACPNEVVQLLCEKNVLSIVGNYDLEVIGCKKTDAKGEKRRANKFAKKELSKACACYLFSLPRELRLEIAGKKTLVTHGSPESIEEHIYHDTPVDRLNGLAADAKADLIIVGHSHEQFSTEANSACFVNPGSVGRPGDGNSQAAYAILSFNPFKVELVRVDYDVEAAADALRKKGLPESFAQMLLQGESLDTILVEDQTKKKNITENCPQIVEASKDFALKCWPDTEHFTQVTKLALQFFDGLISVHSLGNQERCWLECASILHDIGLSQSGSSHHKKSAKLILNSPELPFSSQDRRIIASIARYHRKGLPKPNNYHLASLDSVTIHKIKVLAALLRIADGLDYTHQAVVGSINFKVGTKKIIVECLAKNDSMLEEQAFNKKKDLFEKVLGKKLVLIWKKP
jgi:putative phosphoesterase